MTRYSFPARRNRGNLIFIRGLLKSPANYRFLSLYLVSTFFFMKHRSDFYAFSNKQSNGEHRIVTGMICFACNVVANLILKATHKENKIIL